ncbi:MAG TPA: hypothetical protein VGN64_12905 [Dyadobacter sp.]|jgi:hypothetical protein|nr:hypothetical protein [Dyadobacter sp.]
MLTAFALVQEVSAAARIQVTGNFAMVEPLTDQEYVVTEYDIPATATNYSVTWTFVGLQSTATLEYDNRSTSPLMTKWKAKKAQWSNTPNGFGIHAVYAVMTYKVGTTTYSLTSPTLQVQVKHIGSIVTLNVAGTNYTNGQYRNQACGGSTLALSVPAAATDPFSAVNYTWTFPSGWSPASITTTSTSVSVNSNVAGGGTIKVEAKRVDGTTKTSILLNNHPPLTNRSHYSCRSPVIVFLHHNNGYCQ